MLVVAITLVAVLLVAFAPVPQDQESADAAGKAAAFRVDSGHSTIHFRIRHLGVSNFHGRINKVRGEYSLLPENVEASSLNVFAEIKDIDTASEGRERHLKSPDFFNAHENPELSFKSTSVARSQEGVWSITGDLTMHGVTKSIVVNIDNYAEAETRMGFRSGFEVIITVNRSDFGMNKYIEGGMLSDEVRITVAIEGIKNS